MKEELKPIKIKLFKPFPIMISGSRKISYHRSCCHPIRNCTGSRDTDIQDQKPEDDIALSLAAMGIRIIAPIPRKGTIGIEVPNKNPEIVSIRSPAGTDKFKSTSFELPFVFREKQFQRDLYRRPGPHATPADGRSNRPGKIRRT